MKIKCERKGCTNEATVHLTEILGGQKIEKHLCQKCAVAEGITQEPLQVLKELLMQSTALADTPDVKCSVCGMTFQEFRQKGLLGCPNDYHEFESLLAPLLERAHGGDSFHAGKIPPNAAGKEQRQDQLLRLRARLKEAVAREEYEQAARLRDDIKKLEAP
jgi:protein arginine kinase activator